MLDVTSHAVWTQSRYTTCIDKHFHVPSRGCCRWWMMWQHWPWYSELKYSPNSESHYTVLVSNTSLTSNINPIRANVTSFCTSPVLCSHWNQLWALFSVILCNGIEGKFDFFIDCLDASNIRSVVNDATAIAFKSVSPTMTSLTWEKSWRLPHVHRRCENCSNRCNKRAFSRGGQRKLAGQDYANQSTVCLRVCVCVCGKLAIVVTRSSQGQGSNQDGSL